MKDDVREFYDNIGWSQVVNVRPFSRYKLTGWNKTENVRATSGRGALFNLHHARCAVTHFQITVHG